jgi:hypothetical protein
MLRYKAKLYWLLRSLTIRLENDIAARLRKAGFIFNDETAPQVIRSIMLKTYDE